MRQRWAACGVGIATVVALCSCSDALPATPAPRSTVAPSLLAHQEASYRAVIASYGPQLSQDLTSATQACAGPALAPCQSAMTTAATEAATWLTAMGPLTVPAHFRTADAQLRQALGDLHSACASAASALASGDTQGLQAAITQLRSGDTLLTQAEQSLSAAHG